MEKVVYKVGTFTDFSGLTRQAVIVAVTVATNSIIFTEQDDFEKEEFSEKVLRLGISVQNPQDIKVNTELGKTIALGKAKNDRSCIGKLYTTNKGMINQKMVEALLDQEFEHFQNAPHLYIKGYKKDKELYKSNPKAYYSKFKLN